MGLKLKVMLVGATAASLVAAGVVVGTGFASAYTGTPPWETPADSAAKGGLIFHDAAGAVITGGSDINDLAAYISTSTAPQAGANKVTLQVAAPDHTNPIVAGWPFNQAQAAYTFTPTPAGTPASVTGTGFVKLSALGVAISDVASGFAGVGGFPGLDNTAQYQNVLQLRLIDTGPGVAADGNYWRADIEFNPAAAGGATYDGLAPQAWKVVYPAAASGVATSVSMPVATPAGPQAFPVTVSLSATVSAADSSHPDGTVDFFDGATNVGAATFTAATGVATLGGLTPAVGTRSYTAVFTPMTASVNGSTSPPLSYTVQAAPGIATSVVIPVATPLSPAPSGSTVSLSTTVSAADSTHPDGTVEFFDGATSIGTATFTAATGAATLGGLTPADGAHSYKAVFTPSAAGYDPSPPSPVLPYTVTAAPFVLPPPAVVSAPSLAGAARVGGSLTCNLGAWTYAGSYSYKWLLDAAVVPFRTTANTGVLPVSYFGHRVRCEVTASNPAGSAAASTAQAVVVAGAASVARVRPRILGLPRVGRVLAAYRGVWSPAPTAYRYLWKRGSVVVSHALRYRATRLDKGKVLVLYVFAFRTGYLTGVSTGAARVP